MTENEAKEKLFEHLSRKIQLTEEDKKHIAEAYSFIQIKKKQHLFEAGSECKLEAFVISGTFRIYYIDDKVLEHVLYFAFEDWWVGDVASFASHEPSGLNAQALEDSWILVTNLEKKEALLEKVPALERFFRIILQKNLSVLQKRFLLTVSANAAERYQELITRSPGIEQLVPQHQIASYLGILPESLSRMKKQLLK